jgi:2,3-dihydroxyphenylpropionate 1,2-dioxygenase
MDESGRIALLCTSHGPLMLRDPEHVQGREFRAAFAQAAEFVKRFDPELVVFFGTEHRRTLHDIVAPFTVFCTARGYGDFETSDGPYDIPTELSVALLETLSAADIDAAHGEDAKLDHGFGLTMGELFGPNDALPVLPILINCVNPPLPSMKRSRAFGAAVGRFLRTLDKRLLVLASGGLSHSPITLTRANAGLTEAERVYRPPDYIESAGRQINPGWDTAFLGALRAGDWATLERLAVDEIESAGVGANEVRTWLAATAAAQPASLHIAYEPVPAWITGMGIAYGPLEAA